MAEPLPGGAAAGIAADGLLGGADAGRLLDAQRVHRGSFIESRRRGRMPAFFGVVGPAFVAAVAYVDPGNFATNLEGGAHYGYLLMWAVFAASIVAMLIQYLSAKLGAATGRDLPQLLGNQGLAVRVLLWIEAEAVSMLTDVAEIVGAAVGMNLLFGVSLPVGGVLATIAAVAITTLRDRGYRRYEIAIGLLLILVFVGFLFEALQTHPSFSAAAHGVIPHLHGSDSLLLAVGIIGATIMPHVIYAHSRLTRDGVEPPLPTDTPTGVRPSDPSARRQFLRYVGTDIGLGLGIAAAANLVMLAVFAALLGGHGGGSTGFDAARRAFQDVGPAAAPAFAAVLVISGLAASSVGTFAGQSAMEGFGVWRRLPALWLRRLITALPALILLASGVDAIRALILSQVGLSFGIPFALIPLVILTARREVMGEYRNRRTTTVLAGAAAVAIVAANVYLLYSQLG